MGTCSYGFAIRRRSGRRPASGAALSRRFEYCGWLLLGQPAAAVGAHVLDQRDEGPTLVGELIGDARRDLGERAALDDALLLERPEAERERPGADALQRPLELAEPKRGVRQIADDEEGPLAGDDLGG